jgi:predicted permease
MRLEHWYYTVPLRLRSLFRRGQVEQELDEELQYHLGRKIEENIARGLTPEEARYAAMRAMDGLDQQKEYCRDMRRVTVIEHLIQDLRYGLRMLAKSPGFAVVAVVTLALGIGANTALFSLLNTMLLRALPVKNPEELVEFVRAHPSGAMMTNLPYPVYTSFRQDRNVLSAVFAIGRSNPTFRAGAAAELVDAHEVSGSFFPTLGVNPLLGRIIGPDDDQPGAANHVAVLNYAFWRRRFGGDLAILGRTVGVSGEPFTIIGAMPSDFFGVDRGHPPDLWVPLATDPDPGEVWVLGRLKPGISIPQARVQLEPLFRQALDSLKDEFKSSPEYERAAFLSQRLMINRAVNGTAGLRWRYWEYSNTLKVLLGLAGLVLLIACANLANLLMARSVARAGEIGIRLAIGAGRWRVVRQLLTENLLLSLAGGVLGLLVAAGGHRLLLTFLVGDPQTVALHFRLDYRVLGFGLALSIATGVLFSLFPVVRCTRADLAAAIHGSPRQFAAARIPLARTLLAIQVALSMVLVAGAGLFTRSLRNLGAADLGLARENLVLMDVQSSTKDPLHRQTFWSRLTERVSSLPGVRSVALAGDAVFGNGGWNQTVWIERPGKPAQDVHVCMNLVGSGFFATVGIPVLVGREFGEQDDENSALVALVNQAFARQFFSNESPIGKRFGDRGQGSSGRYEIVGMVGDAKYGTVREPSRPMVFHPLLQEPRRASFVLHVRTQAQPTALLPSIRREILTIDNDVLITDVRTLPQVIRSQLRKDRMFVTLASFFALLALALGAIGIYGIVAYEVAHRTPEIGVRVALGAQRGDVLWLVMRETLLLLAAGTIIGVPAALAATGLIKSLLYGLEPSDPVTIVCATITLFAAGALAAFLPARRAASVEPLLALRSE